MRVEMVKESQGYPIGTVLEVTSCERAARWIASGIAKEIGVKVDKVEDDEPAAKTTTKKGKNA